MSDLRKTIIDYADNNAEVYQKIALAIHDKPEVSDFEFFACDTLSSQLEKEGFTIEKPAAGHRTAFAASYKSSKPGPVVVVLSEYDALGGL